jgi:protein SCO1/2
MAALAVTTIAGWANADKGSVRKSSSASSTTLAKAAGPDSAPGKASAIASPKDLRSLIDQDGRPFSFARLGKKTVLVNFIFTSCPMQCPAQTQALVGLQRALPPALRARVLFVSLTVDPDRDSAAALKRYALAMGADLSAWSFLTGKESELNWLYRYFSVGVKAIADGQYDHQMGAYLLDAQGRVMQRYTGDLDKPRLLREIGEVDALNK